MVATFRLAFLFHFPVDQRIHLWVIIREFQVVLIRGVDHGVVAGRWYSCLGRSMTFKSLWLFVRPQCGTEFSQKSVISACHLSSVFVSFENKLVNTQKFPDGFLEDF